MPLRYCSDGYKIREDSQSKGMWVQSLLLIWEIKKYTERLNYTSGSSRRTLWVGRGAVERILRESQYIRASSIKWVHIGRHSHRGFECICESCFESSVRACLAVFWLYVTLQSSLAYKCKALCQFPTLTCSLRGLLDSAVSHLCVRDEGLVSSFPLWGWSIWTNVS